MAYTDIVQSWTIIDPEAESNLRRQGRGFQAHLTTTANFSHQFQRRMIFKSAIRMHISVLQLHPAADGFGL